MTEQQEITKPKILIVEDEAIIADELKGCLRQLGYTVLAHAFAAEKALPLIEQEPPDLILMDIVLKGRMDGIEAADIIHSRWGIPVVFITAHADQGRLERAKLAYPFGYVMKPFDDNSIRIAIEMALYVSKIDAARRKAEVALREREERLRLTLEAVNEGVWDWNISTGKAVFSPSYYTMLGYEPYAFSEDYASWRSLVHSDDIDRAEKEITACLAKNKNYAIEIRLRRKSGDWTWILTRGKAIEWDDQGKPARMVGTHSDITERKRTEDALRENEEKYRQLFELESDAIFLIDNDTGQIYEVNPAAERLYGYSREELLRMKNTELSAESEKTRQAMAEKLTQIPTRFHHRKDGSAIPVEITATHLNWKGRPMHIAAIRDITRREQAEKKIKAGLREKEVLLKEIHHRVKNNLQVISSLLGLQSRQTRDADARRILKEAQDRVGTMALIHEKLYGSGDLARIEFGGYIHGLVSNLGQSQGVSPDKVKWAVEVKDVFLEISKAVPCGLIVNELISNSMKYAFPDGREGEILVAMREEGKQILLRVRDNGVGFPADLDFRETKSLGLQLVVLLVEQVEGTIELHRKGGTEFRISFPKEKP